MRDTSQQDIALRPGRRWGLLGTGAIAATVAGLGLLAYQWRSSAPPELSAADISTSVVDRGPVIKDLAADARVVAASNRAVYAPAAGIVALRSSAGQEVEAGAVIAVVNSPDSESRVAQERASLDSAQAEVARARLDLELTRASMQSAFEVAQIDFTTASNELGRQRSAFEAGATARMVVDQAKDKRDKAEIALRQAELNASFALKNKMAELRGKEAVVVKQQVALKELLRLAEASVVRSPLKGRVGQVFVSDFGAVAKDAQIASIIDLSRLEVEMRVPEGLARELSSGMTGNVQATGINAPVVVNAVSPEVVNNEVLAKLAFKGPVPPSLRQNQRVSAYILLAEKENVLRVKAGAGFTDGTGAAFVLRDGAARRQVLRYGLQGTQYTEIIDGAKEGDEIVLGDLQRFGDAAMVRIRK